MREFARYAPTAFEAYTKVFDYYSSEFKPYMTLALCDEALALRLLEMPFMTVIRDGHDRLVLDALARLTASDVGDVDELLAHPLLQDGITDLDAPLVLMLVLEHERPEAAAMIGEVPWLREIVDLAGASEDEVDTSARSHDHASFFRLIEIANSSPASLRVLLELPWMQNHQIEPDQWLTGSRRSSASLIQLVTNRVRGISVKSDFGMASVLQMPFLQTLEPVDKDILDVLWEAANAGQSWATPDDGRNYRDGGVQLWRLLSDPIFEGGITNDDLGHAALADLRIWNAGAAEDLEGLPWTQDGLSPSESAAIFALWQLEDLGADIFQRVVRQRWVADGITAHEASVLHTFEQLVIAARNLNTVEGYPWHEDYVLTIPDKPFMRSIGPSDATLFIATDLLLQHNRMVDRPDLLSVMLESGDTQKAERLITLPLAGEVALSVVWPAAIESDRTVRRDVSVSRTLDILEQAVRALEEFVGLPFPHKHASVLIWDHGGFGGTEALFTIAASHSDSVNAIVHGVARTYGTPADRRLPEGLEELINSLVSK